MSLLSVGKALELVLALAALEADPCVDLVVLDFAMPGMNGAGRLMQNYVETSNVNVVEEMVSMIQTQRAYEINSKAVQTSDEGEETIYLLEVNPRASRTVPFVSKAIGKPLAKISARCMAGKTLAAGATMVVVVLLALQPDFGQASLVLFSWGVMYFVAGAPPSCQRPCFFSASATSRGM